MDASKNGKYSDIPKNYQDFVLVQKTHAKPEDYGFTTEQVLYLLGLIKDDPNSWELEDDETQNDLGCFFDDGVCVEKNIEFAKYWYAKSADQGNDLARSNLADIYRKGKDGSEVDLKKAFELYPALFIDATFSPALHSFALQNVVRLVSSVAISNNILVIPIRF